MTHGEARWKLESLVWAAILLLTWVVAGMFNAGECIMGGPPSTRGAVATLVAVFAWPAAGWFASRSGAHFVRLATVFWTAVMVGTPLIFWMLSEGPGFSAGQGGGVLILLGFILAAPLYGLAALLPTWGSFAYGTLFWTVLMGMAVLAISLVADLVRRRIVGTPRPVSSHLGEA